MAQFEIKNGVAIIPEGTTKFGSRAFRGCTSLTSITIPASVTEIGMTAFQDCTSLKSVTISESVKEIGCEAFKGCRLLDNIVVAEGNPKYDSREGCNAIIETATNTLIAGCKVTVIPESVTVIGRAAFSNYTRLKSIIIPEGVTYIGKNAFFA